VGHVDTTVFLTGISETVCTHVSSTGWSIAHTWKLYHHLPTVSLQHFNLSLHQT
jgi:hypothetical protein